MHKRGLATFVALVIVSGVACTRDDGEVETGGGDTSATTAAPDATTDAGEEPDEGTGDEGDEADATGIDVGGFGDLEAVCGEGEPGTVTETGLSADEIRIGVITDKGFSARPGLNQEMFDTANAFAAWCNSFGGIGGREIVISDRDSRLSEYSPTIQGACAEDFALVGGGAVFDDADAGLRIECGLPDIAGYVVTPLARAADLRVQPVPNPVYQLPIGGYRAVRAAFPDATNYAVLTVGLPATLVVRDTSLEAAEAVGFDVVVDREYGAGGESNWRPFVEQIRDAEVDVLEVIGEPENLVAFQQAMDVVGFHPQVTLQNANFYDSNYANLAGDAAIGTLVRSVFHPFELAADNKATQDYLDIMEEFNPDGKIAQLGVQAMSAWLLFATSAAACGADLSRECLITEAQGVTEWTGGGLHGTTNPSTNTPSPCYALLAVEGGGFTYDEELTAPDEGLFNCDPENILELQGDYGVPRE